MKRLILLLVIISLAGCSIQRELRTEPEVLNDEFGTSVIYGVEKEDSLNGYYMLRTFMGDSVITQLYVEINYYADNWRFYNRASDKESKLNFSQIRRDVSCYGSGNCKFEEIVGVIIPEGKLRKAAKKNYQIKLYSKSGRNIVITITKNQASKQVEAIKQFKL